MKVAIIAVCVAVLITSSHGFIGGDGLTSLAVLNSMSGRRPFDFGGMFGGRSPVATRVAGQGQAQRVAGQSYSAFGGLFGPLLLMEGI